MGMVSAQNVERLPDGGVWMGECLHDCDALRP